jgi:hypothetical protein
MTDKQFENILKSPEKYHGQEVEIAGVFHERFEDHAIYLTKNSSPDKAIWVNFSETLMSPNTFSGLDGQKVSITGTFDKTDKGHLVQYAGSLNEARILKID